MENIAVKNISDKEFIIAWNMERKLGRGSAEKLAKSLGISKRYIWKVRAAVEKRNNIELKSISGGKGQKRHVTLNEPKPKLVLAEETPNEVSDLIKKLLNSRENAPDWTYTPKPQYRHGVPTLMLSDLHWGETVDKRQVGGVNEYNLDIAHKRLEKVFHSSVDLLRGAMSSSNYPGIVVALGGDLNSGYIHDELRDTKSISLLDGVLDLTDQLVAGIRFLKNEFGKVFVPVVVGNHGRLDHKPRCKGAVEDNVDWMVGQLIKKRLAGDSNVTVAVSDSFDYLYRIYGTRYLLTHGDQFRGGSGISGILTPLTLGNHRKSRRQVAINQPYDYMLMGHHHQLTWLPSMIVNGSLVGYNEFSYRMNFGFERPQQALWLTHPEHGITCRWNVLADSSEVKEQSNWISILSS